MSVQHLAAGYERVKSSVFSLRLKTDRDGDDVTSGGKLFQTRAAATGNARSPIVECFVRGMTSAAVFTPLLKRHGLDASDPADCRPTSNLNTIIKILERLVLTRLFNTCHCHRTSTLFNPHTRNIIRRKRLSTNWLMICSFLGRRQTETATVKTATRRNDDKPKRRQQFSDFSRQPKRRHAGTTTNRNDDTDFSDNKTTNAGTTTNRNDDNDQNDDKPKRRHAETTTNRNDDKPKRRHAETTTNRNDDKQKRRQTETPTSKNDDKPKRRQQLSRYFRQPKRRQSKRRQTRMATIISRLLPWWRQYLRVSFGVSLLFPYRTSPMVLRHWP